MSFCTDKSNKRQHFEWWIQLDSSGAILSNPGTSFAPRCHCCCGSAYVSIVVLSRCWMQRWTVTQFTVLQQRNSTPAGEKEVGFAPFKHICIDKWKFIWAQRGHIVLWTHMCNIDSASSHHYSKVCRRFILSRRTPKSFTKKFTNYRPKDLVYICMENLITNALLDWHTIFRIQWEIKHILGEWYTKVKN